MWNKRCALLLAVVPVAGSLFAQQPALDAANSVKIDLPADSPVTLISTSTGQSRVTPRGGMLVLDLHMSLTLRNSGARSVRGVTLLITAQEFTPGAREPSPGPASTFQPGRISPFPSKSDS